MHPVRHHDLQGPHDGDRRGAHGLEGLRHEEVREDPYAGNDEEPEPLDRVQGLHVEEDAVALLEAAADDGEEDPGEAGVEHEIEGVDAAAEGDEHVTEGATDGAGEGQGHAVVEVLVVVVVGNGGVLREGGEEEGGLDVEDHSGDEGGAEHELPDGGGGFEHEEGQADGEEGLAEDESEGIAEVEVGQTAEVEVQPHSAGHGLDEGRHFDGGLVFVVELSAEVRGEDAEYDGLYNGSHQQELQRVHLVVLDEEVVGGKGDAGEEGQEEALPPVSALCVDVVVVGGGDEIEERRLF